MTNRGGAFPFRPKPVMTVQPTNQGASSFLPSGAALLLGTCSFLFPLSNPSSFPSPTRPPQLFFFFYYFSFFSSSACYQHIFNDSPNPPQNICFPLYYHFASAAPTPVTFPSPVIPRPTRQRSPHLPTLPLRSPALVSKQLHTSTTRSTRQQTAFPVVMIRN